MSTNNKPLSNEDIFAQRPSNVPDVRVKRFPIWLLVIVPAVMFFSIFIIINYINDKAANAPYNYVTYECNRFEGQTLVVPLETQLQSSELDMKINAVHYNVPQDLTESKECKKATLVDVTVRNVSGNELFSETSPFSISLFDGETQRYSYSGASVFDRYIKKNTIVLLDKKITNEEQRGWLLFTSSHDATDDNLTLIIPGDVVDGFQASANISNNQHL